MSIEISGIDKSFGPVQVLNTLSLTVPCGQLLALLGPSGSGKTTLLRIIAGLEWQDRGRIFFHGRDVSQTHARYRQAGFVFQHYALFRHMTVFENVAFGLRVQPRRRRLPSATIKVNVMQLLERVQLTHLMNRYPAQLSGGQQQRVALARALATKPGVLLLDEPFGALDAQVRKELRLWLRTLHEELKFTCIFVTHDQEEAMDVAERIVIMRSGSIEQSGEAREVWREPATRFVLEFLGEVNHFQGCIKGACFHVAQGEWPLGYTPAYQGNIEALLRPWEIDISHQPQGITPLPVIIQDVNPRGHYWQLTARPDGWHNSLISLVFINAQRVPRRGEKLFIGLQRSRLYDGETLLRAASFAQSA